MGVCTAKKSDVIEPCLQLDPAKEWMSPLSSRFSYIQTSNIQKHYHFKELIGTGFFGFVRLAVRTDGISKDLYAVKSINKEKVTSQSSLRSELETLHLADHPNIIRLFDIFEDQHYIHIVMEHCCGGDIGQRLLANHRFSEQEAALLLHKLLHAVSYLHRLNVSHRDIKAENVLFSTTDAGAEVKLIDFGLSTKFREDSDLQSLVGTPYYVAPEVLSKQYGPECDVWSVGVLLYFMLSGEPPFIGQSKKEVYYKILQEECSFQAPVWTEVSSEVKCLISQMLCKSRQDRISATQAMDHPWFAHTLSQDKLNTKLLKRLARLNQAGTLRSDVLTVITRHLATEEVTQLNSFFRLADTQHTGYVSIKALNQALCQLSDKDKVENIVATTDSVCYTDFLRAAMDRRVLLDKEVRWMTFKYFDETDKGYLTVDNIQRALERLGVTKSTHEVKSLAEAAGLKYDKWIDYEEFCRLLDPLPDDLSSCASSIAEAD